MTSTPRKLDELSQEQATFDRPSSTIMSSMDEVIATLLADETFKSYRIETPADDTVSVSRDGMTQILLGPNLWKSLERRMPFLANAGQPGISICCVGNEADLREFPPELRRPDVQQIGLPMSRINLGAVLQSMHNFLTLVAHSHAEAAEVEEATKNVKVVMSISRELNGTRDIPKLLNLILKKAREICNADAGSIFTLTSPTENVRDGTLQFRFTQNDSIQQNLSEFTMPVNEASVVGNACIHQVAINIPDLYKLSATPSENPYGTRHDRTWDKRLGYESHSMLTVPMFDISHNVIGVIQLINRKKNKDVQLKTPDDFADQVIAFDEVDQEMAEIVAQQAGIALENANMHQSIVELFDGFVDASVTAIEQRDPTTSGHSHRVAHLTVGLAKVVHRCDGGIYKSVTFTEAQLQEVEYASLLHDFGKLGVRENVLVKAKKLYPWEMDLLLQRFDLIKSGIEIDYLKRVIEYLQAPDHFPMGANPYTFEAEKNQRVTELEDFLKFVAKANEPTVLEQGGFERLKDIANLTFKNVRGDKTPYLTKEELNALSVSRGSLTRDEFAEIQSHVTHTYDFLRQIPWGKRLANVPQIAAKHHEKLDGSGYPTSAEAEEIPVQTRMMTIADIFDALTASDRPYKKAVPVDRALDILEMEVKGGKLDSELFRLFKDSKVYEPVLDPNFAYGKVSSTP
jgi:HD-GYP domain-containing protein (c-di-GMP phosphodiesterase class II)